MLISHRVFFPQCQTEIQKSKSFESLIMSSISNRRIITNNSKQRFRFQKSQVSHSEPCLNVRSSEPKVKLKEFQVSKFQIQKSWVQSSESELCSRPRIKITIERIQDAGIWRRSWKTQENKVQIKTKSKFLNQIKTPESSDDNKSIKSFKTQETSIRITESTASAGAPLGTWNSLETLCCKIKPGENKQDLWHARNSRSRFRYQILWRFRKQLLGSQDQNQCCIAFYRMAVLCFAVLQECCKSAARLLQECCRMSRFRSRLKK